jgi:hypothetical protein
MMAVLIIPSLSTTFSPVQSLNGLDLSEMHMARASARIPEDIHLAVYRFTMAAGARVRCAAPTHTRAGAARSCSMMNEEITKAFVSTV